MATARYLVVVAGQNPQTVDGLAATLRETCTVRVAYSADALERSLDDEVHVALVTAALARSVPDHRLQAWRSTCLVAVLGDGEDASIEGGYTVSPSASPAAVRRRVGDLAERAVYRRKLDRYYELSRRRAEIHQRDPESDELDRIGHQIERLEHALDEALDRLSAAAAFDAGLGSDADESE